jgi:hypothetical protein
MRARGWRRDPLRLHCSPCNTRCSYRESDAMRWSPSMLGQECNGHVGCHAVVTCQSEASCTATRRHPAKPDPEERAHCVAFPRKIRSCSMVSLRSFNFHSAADVEAYVAEHGREVLEIAGIEGGFGSEADFHWYHAWLNAERQKLVVAREAQRDRQAMEREKVVDAREERAVAAAERAARSARWSAIWASVAVLVATGAALIAAGHH